VALKLGNITLAEQLLVSYGIGTAAGPAIQPFAQLLANKAWELNAIVPPDALYLAQGVAQGQVAPADAYAWAKQQGFATPQMDALVAIANVGPGAGYAFELWRRGLIDQGGFATALKRLGLEDGWVGPLAGLHDTLLSSEELGMMQQQGFVDAARANEEGAKQGVTAERQQLRFEASGLPPGIETLEMLRRDIIGEDEFTRIVREGHTKTKYTGELLALRHPVLHAAEYATLHLKGHITKDEMDVGGRLTGYTPEQMNLLYLGRGRPATVHQIHVGYARGEQLPGASSERDAIATAVKQSDIRPEYTDLLFAGRATYPSLFQLTRLVGSGTISADTGAEWARKAGLADEVVTALHQEWSASSGGASADTHVAKAQTQLWTTTHRSYLADESSDADATTALRTAGVASGSIPAVLAIWQAERDLTRKQLTAAQVVKAYKKAVRNPATGQPWTLDEARTRLVQMGYSVSDATTLLAE
jgi:hypothetical protein